MEPTQLCDLCEELIKTLCNNPPSLSRQIRRTSFYDTATNCDLCKLITHVDSTRHFLRGRNFPMELKVFFRRSRVRGQVGPVAAVWFTTWTTTWEFCVEFSIWVDDGNNTPRDLGISTERPIFTNNPYEAVSLIRRWFQECLVNHEHCLQTVCGNAIDRGDCVTLPTRVLSVVNLGNIMLLESHSLQGRYCALSHCWGPPGNQPLQTVKENLRVHLTGIPFSALPRTFQEACIITHELGIDYLWIDSLCIIQDDLDDWSREAQVMGSIYEKAILMISAAGSADSSGGCFVTERPEHTPTASIFVETDYERIECLNLRLISQAPVQPSLGPLARRGWTLQERYMARRKLFFMPGGISWACRSSTMDESSIDTDLEIKEYHSWPSLLEEYTRSKLTLVSDRLPAIQGIVTGMENAGKGRCFFGVWDTGLLVQCLWISVIDTALGDVVPDVPSWSWARTSGAKLWPFPEYTISLEARVEFHNSGPKMLSASGLLRVIDQSTRANDCCVSNFTNRFERILHYIIAEYSLFRNPDGELCRPYALRDQNGQLLGLGVFDQQTASCCVFASWASEETDPCFLRPKLRHRTPDQEPGLDSLNPVDSTLSSMETCEKEDCIYLPDIMEEMVYYGLLLEPVDDAMIRFRRVGIGVMYPPAFTNAGEDLVRRDYEII